MQPQPTSFMPMTQQLIDHFRAPDAGGSLGPWFERATMPV